MEQVSALKKATATLEKEAGHAEADAYKHAAHIRSKVKPAMAAVRALVDDFETKTAADLWPVPSYRELLFTR